MKRTLALHYLSTPAVVERAESLLKPELRFTKGKETPRHSKLDADSLTRTSSSSRTGVENRIAYKQEKPCSGYPTRMSRDKIWSLFYSHSCCLGVGNTPGMVLDPAD